MTGAELLELEADLEQYLASYDELMGRRENRENLRRFARGQLGTVERKSLEPLADAEGVEPRSLQEFFSRHRWDTEGVRTQLQRRIAEAYGGPDGIFLVDETSDAKKGAMTAGVARQYCGATGKIDNCIVSVHLAYARGAFHSLLDGELFLPECWNANAADPQIQEKRRLAAIPVGVGHVAKPEMALQMLARALRNRVPGRWVGADELYGRSPAWRAGVAALSLYYVVEVPKNLEGWLRRPTLGPPPPWRGRGRPPTRREPDPPARTVEAWAAQAGGWRGPWSQFRVHDTQKGPEVWEARWARFYEAAERAPCGPQKLIVARNVRTGEVKYFLTNAPDQYALVALLGVAFSRWRVERCFQDAKEELGLDHAEMRKYLALQRQLLLTAVNLLFLRQWQLAHGQAKQKDLTLSQVADALQVLLACKVEGIMTRRQLRVLAEQLAAKITRTQARNRRARRSACKRRRRELRALGVRLTHLRCCDKVSL